MPIPMYCDNQSTIFILGNPTFHEHKTNWDQLSLYLWQGTIGGHLHTLCVFLWPASGYLHQEPLQYFVWLIGDQSGHVWSICSSLRVSVRVWPNRVDLLRALLLDLSSHTYIETHVLSTLKILNRISSSTRMRHMNHMKIILSITLVTYDKPKSLFK